MGFTVGIVPFPNFDLLKYVKLRAPSSLMSGKHLRINCVNPNCADFSREYKRRLWIDPDKNTGWCYRCHKKFDPPSFVMLYERCSYRQSLEFLGSKKHDEVYGSLDDARMRMFKKPTKGHLPPPKVDLPHFFIPVRSKLPRFAKERGLTLEQCRKHKIGWCSAGRYAHRLIIPVYFNGVRVSWVGRAMWDVKPPAPGEEELPVHKKVVNAPGTHTGRFLYNYDRAKDKERLVIVEGPFDAIAVGDEAVALFGTNLSMEQYRLLLETKAKKVVVLLDPDKAGRQAADEIVSRLRGMFLEVTAPQISSDPDELSPKELQQALSSRAEVSLSSRIRALIS